MENNQNKSPNSKQKNRVLQSIKKFLDKTLDWNTQYHRLNRRIELKQTLSKDEWQNLKYNNYQHVRNLRSMQWSIAIRYIRRIAMVAIIMLISSILIISSIMIPFALNLFKTGVAQGFGEYNSYSEYRNTPLNVPVAKGNAQQSFDGSITGDNAGTNPPSWKYPVGGPFDPTNGGRGTDNRYSIFNSSDDAQTDYTDSYFSPIQNLGLFSYLGGYVISTKWVNNLKNNPLANSAALTPVICKALGVQPKPGWSGVDCITEVIRENAPSYINQKLFGNDQSPNIYLTAADLNFNYLEDNLFTHISGNIENNTNSNLNTSSEIWGLNPNSQFNLYQGKTNLLSELNTSSSQYLGKNVFPCFINQTLANDLKVRGQSSSNFSYQANYSVAEYSPDGKNWYAVNPNNYYWVYNNGLSVYYDTQPSANQTSSYYNARSGYVPTGQDPTKTCYWAPNGTTQKDCPFNTYESIDALIAEKKFRVVNVPYKVQMHSIGIAKDYGTARIYTTHTIANEIGGYYSASHSLPRIYSNKAISPYVGNQTNNNEMYETQYASIPAAGTNLNTPISDADLKSLVQTNHIASDGYPSQIKKWGSDISQSNLSQVHVTGGYTLNSLKTEQSDIYFNGRLSLSTENSDLSTFAIWSPYGNYDRYGLSSSGSWDPSQYNASSAFTCASAQDPTCFTASSSSSSAVGTAYSKMEVENAIDKVINLVTTIIYVVLFFFLIISLIIIAVSTNIVIDDNKRNISTFKVLGYRESEIIKIITQPYFIVASIAFLIAIPIVLSIFSVILQGIGSAVGLNLADSGVTIFSYVKWWFFVVAFIIVIAIYLLNIIFNKRTLSKIKAIDVLKG